MKPKNRFFCKDSGKLKLLFESEKKAGLFIKFNSEEIESESGYSPIRTYFCISCNGWHVTSKSEIADTKSKTEQVLESYYEEKNRKAFAREQKIAIEEELLAKIDNKINEIEITQRSGELKDCIAQIDSVYEDLEHAKKLKIGKRKLKIIKNKLNIFLFVKEIATTEKSENE